MTQDLYLRIGKIRHLWDQLQDVGTIRPSPSQSHELQTIHQELFGNTFNGYCAACLGEALKNIIVAHDKYIEANAPVILTAGQQASIIIEDRPKRGRRGKN